MEKVLADQIVRRRKRFAMEPELRPPTLLRMLQAATALVSTDGLRAVTFERLASKLTRTRGSEKRRTGMTRTSAAYYFGTRVGLLGAIAEREFWDLAERLRAAVSERQLGLVELAAIYARFALERPNVYRAVHHADLWRLARQRKTDAYGITNAWARCATIARDHAFEVFSGQAAKVQVAARLPTDGVTADDIAQLTTAIVDGYMFQVLEERVDSDLSVQQHVERVARFVKIALTGIAKTSDETS